MQIIDLYIRDGNKYNSIGNFPTQTRLVDTSTDFTTSDFKVGQIIENLTTGILGTITAIAPSGNVNALDIDGGGFSGNNQPYKIYNEYTKLDLFKDESVSITDSIQNVKDPSKIFAPFSQQFSVPASKNNNKVFKHYYNGKIENSYDARYKGDALIQLNGLNYKIGKFSLTSVELKNNVAYSYKLVFTGESVEFKDLLAENELSSLDYPDTLNFVYESDFVKSKLRGGSEGDDLVFPLITHSKNMRYGYNNQEGYRDVISDTYINYADLKPALKTKVIIDAIENTYPEIKFSQQFFNSSTFKKLYMWLHREEGFLSNADEGGAVQTIMGRFGFPPNAWTGTLNYFDFVSETELRPAAPYYDTTGQITITWGYEFELTVNTPDVNRTYDVQILKSSDNSEIASFSGTGTQTFIYQFSPENYGLDVIDVKINIITQNTLGITQDLVVTKNYRLGLSNWFSDYSSVQGVYEKPALTDQNVVTISSQMPKMKIFDFLKNIFTMFNLTAYKEDGIINILPLDDYYNEGNSYDITEYVDTEKSKVSKLLQFKNMLFKFKSKKSYLVQFSEEQQGNKFSEESYGNDKWDGGNYNVEVGFEKMMYERLTDEETGDLTKVVQGAMLDKKFEPTIGEPLLLYCLSTQTSGGVSDRILFEEPNQNTTLINPYLRPSNSLPNISTGVINDTLNFGVETDEYTLNTGTQESSNDLFTKYYRNYVANIFARDSRKLNVTAYLPLNVILNYRLNDVFIINNTEYRINSVKTNLLTNKTDLELYNLQVNTSQSINGQRPDLSRVQNLETTSKTSSTIDVQYDNITDTNFERFDIYLDNEYFGFKLQGDLSAGFNVLNPETTYKISIRPIYDIDGTEFAAFDTDLFETTEKEPLALAENGDTLITESSETIILE